MWTMDSHFPETVADLRRVVSDQDPPCTCDYCRPDLSKRCSGNGHRSIVLSQGIKNRYGNLSFTTPFLHPERYRAMYLARKLILYIDEPVELLNGTQLRGMANFHRKMKEYGGRINWTDGPRAIAKYRVASILNCLKDIYLPGIVTKFLFDWFDPADERLGECDLDDQGVPIVRLHPTMFESNI